MQNSVKYPIGIQDFPQIRREGLLYVDKTKYIYDLAYSGTRAYFLSRPRRFGKSLLVSTLKAFFEGRKELFKGLAIEELETEWNEYPVLQFSFATAKMEEPEELRSHLNLQLSYYEETYGRNENEEKPGERFQGLITRAHKQTGKEVVVLIDEYDAPMLNVMHEPEKLENVRKVMNNFYSPLKDCGGMMRFLFLTGITKFSQVSIFSELNNLKLISMLPKYAGICGITEDELSTNFGVGIQELADNNGLSEEKALAALKKNYDGYHFCWPSPDVYNPFSLLNALDDSSIGKYWYASTPSFLVNLLKKSKVTPSQLVGKVKAKASDFDAPVNRMTDFIPLLYQSGYITIKGCNRVQQYMLDVPNREIRFGLMEGLLPYYVPSALECKSTISDMQDALLDDDMPRALNMLKVYLGTVPQTDNTNYEGHWQQVLCIIFTLLGAYADVEVRTPTGRVDLVMCTEQTLYVVEVKLNKSSEAAMEQIDLKDYPERFALCRLPVKKVAINFSMKEKNVMEWVME